MQIKPLYSFEVGNTFICNALVKWIDEFNQKAKSTDDMKQFVLFCRFASWLIVRYKPQKIVYFK